MSDVVSSEIRSRMMSGICGKDTKPELTVRKALFASGFQVPFAPPGSARGS